MMRMPGPGGAAVMMGGRMTRMLGPGLPGGSGGVRGNREVAAFAAWLGAGAPLFRLARLGGTGGSGAWGGVEFEEGVRCLLARIP